MGRLRWKRGVIVIDSYTSFGGWTGGGVLIVASFSRDVLYVENPDAMSSDAIITLKRIHTPYLLNQAANKFPGFS
jgi:hypothetical protein